MATILVTRNSPSYRLENSLIPDNSAPQFNSLAIQPQKKPQLIILPPKHIQGAMYSRLLNNHIEWNKHNDRKIF